MFRKLHLGSGAYSTESMPEVSLYCQYNVALSSIVHIQVKENVRQVFQEQSEVITPQTGQRPAIVRSWLHMSHKIAKYM